MSDDARISSASALRNRGPILDVLRRVLPCSGLVLEIASGTGEHVTHFAAALPGLTFQPTDLDATRRASIDAWATDFDNIRPAMALDATGVWPDVEACAVVCINMIHIAPWAAAEGLIAGAAAVLRAGGVLVTYGPYRQDDVALADGNAAFDADLRARDPRWGLRHVSDVAALAVASGFAAAEIVAMPTNNLCLIFRRGPNAEPASV